MNNQEQQIQNVLNTLRDPDTIRTRSHRILNLAKQNRLEHFSLNPERMTTTASYIVDIITSRYPELDIPYHSRWRHFEMDGLPEFIIYANNWIQFPLRMGNTLRTGHHQCFPRCRGRPPMAL
ncbi:DUF1688 family protein [Legionella pneumophila]|nr:DUF1688 family protein [Legionella pneumophila]